MAITGKVATRRLPWLSVWAVGLSGILAAAPQPASSPDGKQTQPVGSTDQTVQVQYESAMGVPVYPSITREGNWTYAKESKAVSTASSSKALRDMSPIRKEGSTPNFYVEQPVQPQPQPRLSARSEPNFYTKPAPVAKTKKASTQKVTAAVAKPREEVEPAVTVPAVVAPPVVAAVEQPARRGFLSLFSRRDDSQASAVPAQVGKASWYGGDFHGGRTANGERYDMESLTAAHRTLPFGTQIKVTNLENGQECVVRINNRGPFRQGRILDVSRAAARELGMIGRGIAKVQMQILSLGQ